MQCEGKKALKKNTSDLRASASRVSLKSGGEEFHRGSQQCAMLHRAWWLIERGQDDLSDLAITEEK